MLNQNNSAPRRQKYRLKTFPKMYFTAFIHGKNWYFDQFPIQKSQFSELE